MSNTERDPLDVTIIASYVRKHTSRAAREVFSRATLGVFDSVSSTNDIIRALNPEEYRGGSVIVAGEQTKGRGQRGRSFYSPAQSGLYLTMHLSVPITQDISWVTLWVSLCVRQAIIGVLPELKPQIKWVNDIYIDDKKVCGILCESYIEHVYDSGVDSTNEDTDMHNISIGIGCNVYEPEGGFPPKIASKAGALIHNQQDHVRNELAGAVIAQIYNTYAQSVFAPGDSQALQSYKAFSNLIGKRIVYTKICDSSEHPNAAKEFTGCVIDITHDLDLVVVSDMGYRQTYRSGAIRIHSITEP